jgi:tetratricopeptide (TPR) repeat protein
MNVAVNIDPATEFHRLKEEGRRLFSTDPHSAIECYTQALKLARRLTEDEVAPRSIQEVHSNRSALYLTTGRPEDAKKDALKCLKLNPNWFKV